MELSLQKCATDCRGGLELPVVASSLKNKLGNQKYKHISNNLQPREGSAESFLPLHARIRACQISKWIRGSTFLNAGHLDLDGWRLSL